MYAENHQQSQVMLPQALFSAIALSAVPTTAGDGSTPLRWPCMDQEQCQLCHAPVVPLPPALGRRFFHCRRCDLIYEPPSEHLDEVAQKLRYEKHRNTIDNPGYVKSLSRSIDLLGRYARGVHHVLDYGCGPEPVLVELLKRAGYDAVGYDPIFCPLALTDPVERTDLLGDSDTCASPLFDAVVSVETFEHFADPRGALDRIVGLLRPHGTLVIVTQFHQGPHQLQDWWYARDPTHVSFYSHATLDWICGEFCFASLHRDDKDMALLQRA